MFHVKHRRDHMTGNPAEIGEATRELVAECLGTLGFSPPVPRFLARIERFAAELAFWGRRVNLTAVPNDPAELAFHIVDSLMPLVMATQPHGTALHDLFGATRSVLDLGSGAGFPGLILAAACEARFVLLESRRKRANFLEVAAAEMELANVTVDSARRRPDDFEPAFNLVLGRAFAKPAQFYRSAAAALCPGGGAILYATPDQPLDLKAAAGLTRPSTIGYQVSRGNQMVARLLLISRKPS
jgi:16S rRNA (guanine(527)-N(7))-methyltransferase RsmG